MSRNALNAVAEQALPLNLMEQFPSVGPDSLQQSGGDLDAVLAAAADAQPDFRALIQSALRHASLDVADVVRDGGRGPKSREECARRVKEEYAGDASRLVDVLSCSLVVDTEAQLAALARALEATDAVVRLRNRFTRPLWNGYRGALYSVRVVGHLCEVQVHLRALLRHKEGSQRYFEQLQAFLAGGSEAARARRLRLVERLVGDGSDMEARVRALLMSDETAALEDLAALAETVRDAGLRAGACRRLLELAPAHAPYQCAFVAAVGQCGRGAAALPVLRGCLAAARAALGERHPAALKALSNVAKALQALGRAREAEALYRECVRGRQAALGPDHPDTLHSLGVLAALLDAQGDHREAEGYHRQCLALKRAALGDGHPDTLASVSNLATSLVAAGRCREAEGLYRACFVKMQAVLGPGHPDTLSSLHNLALALDYQQEYARAEALYRECLAKRRAALGPSHRETLRSLNNLAIVCGARGAHGEAEGLYRECLGHMRATLGEDHPDTLCSLGNLANVLSSQGKYREAERLHRECVGKLWAALGEQHPDTRRSVNNLAIVLVSQGMDRAEGPVA